MSEPKNGYISKPLTAASNISNCLLFKGFISTKRGDIIVSKERPTTTDDDKQSSRIWAFKAGGLKSFLPRIKAEIEVVGKIAGLMTAKTRSGNTPLVVVDAIAIEERIDDNETRFYHR